MSKEVAITSAELDNAWDKVVETANEIDFKDETIQSFINDVQYQGLNPARIAVLVMRVGATRPNVKEDIMKMIVIGIERGNKLTSMLTRSTDSAQQVIKDLKKAYNLVDKPGRNINALTLSRVALAFPNLACEYAAIATSRTVSVASLPKNFPLQMTHSAFANLIPTTNKTIMKELATMLIYYQVLFTMVVNKESKDMPYQDVVARVAPFVEAGCNSTFVPEEKKVEFLVSWDVLDTANKLSGNTGLVLTEVKKRMRQWNAQDAERIEIE